MNDGKISGGKLALTRHANERQRRVSFEHFGERFDAVAVVANAVN